MGRKSPVQRCRPSQDLAVLDSCVVSQELAGNGCSNVPGSRAEERLTAEGVRWGGGEGIDDDLGALGGCSQV